MSTERQKPSRLRRILPWVFRAIYLSMILAICDCIAAGSSHRDTLFSRNTWRMTDGGTSGYVGFGYSMTYYRRMDASLSGPVVWFWFTPFQISFARSEPELLWLWR